MVGKFRFWNSGTEQSDKFSFLRSKTNERNVYSTGMLERSSKISRKLLIFIARDFSVKIHKFIKFMKFLRSMLAIRIEFVVRNGMQDNY